MNFRINGTLSTAGEETSPLRGCYLTSPVRGCYLTSPVRGCYLTSPVRGCSLVNTLNVSLIIDFTICYCAFLLTAIGMDALPLIMYSVSTLSVANVVPLVYPFSPKRVAVFMTDITEIGRSENSSP